MFAIEARKKNTNYMPFEFPQHFMEPVGSLPCPQETSTGPYSEPDQSNLYHFILSL
jgi:hypothetical protein